MNNACKSSERIAPAQFTLADLLEYTTVCGVLLAFSAVVGVFPILFLMLMAAAMAARIGPLAVASLAAALVAADAGATPIDSGGSFGRQLLAIAVAASLCAWYRGRPRARVGAPIADTPILISSNALPDRNDRSIIAALR
jgi:hypothetical protein